LPARNSDLFEARMFVRSKHKFVKKTANFINKFKAGLSQKQNILP